MKKILKAIMPSTAVSKIRVIYGKLDLYIIKVFSLSGLSSSFYFLVFSQKFRREHKAVLNGRLEYRHSLINIKNSSILLRRNIHRLEKGLIMQPRREYFAESYIEETLDCYGSCLTSGSIDSNEIKWANDVLSEYFDSVIDTKVISRMRCIYQNLPTPVKLSTESEKYIPYKRSEQVTNVMSAQELEALYIKRRSVRWYLEKEVPANNIYKAIELASLAPSACNRQPYEFIVISNPTKAVNVAKLAMGTAGFAENIRSLIVVVGDLSAYPKERDRHVIYIDASLAAMQFMLALETLGLSSCPINWPDIESNEKRLANELNLPSYKRPVMLISVGYADPLGKIPYSQKKSAELLIEEC